MNRWSNTKRAVSRAVVLLACALSTPLAEAVEGAPVDDSPLRFFFLIDQLEHTTTRYIDGDKSGAGLRFNTLGWIGGDYNRLWVYTEGTKPYNGRLEDVDLQLLYGRLVSPFWDLQAGVRYFKPRPGAPSRNYAVLGVQGLAPYRFEVQAATFLSERGDVSARAELEYELFVTQRWILQPRLATSVAIQEVREQGIGRGLNDLEIGVRLRYEIKRELAPYIGVSWQQSFSGTARMARERGDDVGGWRLVAGIRAWF